MGRPKKKNMDPQRSMEQLLKRAVELYRVPYDDRAKRGAELPSVRAVAEQLDTTLLRTRKLLITTGYYSTEMSRRVQEMAAAGKTITKIMEETGLKKASAYSYLPYKNIAFNLDETTVNADRHRVFRRRAKAVKELMEHIDRLDAADYLWAAVAAFQDYPFQMVEHGKKPGVKFRYKVRGEEMVIDRKDKSIGRSTVERAFQNALAMEGIVKGPGALNIPGARSYLYPVFVRLGVIKRVCSEE